MVEGIKCSYDDAYRDLGYCRKPENQFKILLNPKRQMFLKGITFKNP